MGPEMRGSRPTAMRTAVVGMLSRSASCCAKALPMKNAVEACRVTGWSGTPVVFVTARLAAASATHLQPRHRGCPTRFVVP